MKKIFFKFLCTVMVILVLVTSLPSCHGKLDSEVIGSSATSFDVPEKFDTSKNYEITFWAKNDTNMDQVNIYNKTISDFMALYPNIKVNLKLYTDYGRIYQDVITNIATDTTPNVCITYPDHIATYMTGKDTMIPLNDLMTHEKYGMGGSEIKFDSPTSEEIVPKLLEECAFGDVYYALPYMRSTEACYVNKTYVEKLGFTLPETLTWDFIWEVSEAATAKDENGNYIVNGQQVLIPFIYKSTDNMMIQMLNQLDAGYSDKEGKIKIFNDSTKDLLFDISEHTKSGAFCTFKIVGYPANFLNAGQCIFAVDSTAGATWMGTDAPNVDIPEENMVDFETVVMTVPQFDTEDPSMISQGPSVCIFNKEDPQEVLASWIFTQFLLTNEVQIAYAGTEGYVPVTTKAQNSEEYQEYLSKAGEDNEYYYQIKFDATNLLLDNIDNTFVTPVFNGSASLRNAAGQMIEEVTKATRRKKTVDEQFIDDLYKNMTSLYGFEKIDYPFPTESVVLLVTLGTVWVLIIAYFATEKAKKTKKI